MVLYPNTQVDTDTAVTYTLNGIETFTTFAPLVLSRSPGLRPPRMVPAFRLNAADGGAIVLDSDGEALVTVFPPYAVDAQGTKRPGDPFG